MENSSCQWDCFKLSSPKCLLTVGYMALELMDENITIRIFMAVNTMRMDESAWREREHKVRRKFVQKYSWEKCQDLKGK